MFHSSNKNCTNCGILPETLITMVHFCKECLGPFGFHTVWKQFITILDSRSWETSLRLCFYIMTFSRWNGRSHPESDDPWPCRNASLQACWLHRSRCTQLFLFCSSAAGLWSRGEKSWGDQPLRACSGLHCQLQWTAAAQVTGLWDNMGGWCSALWLPMDSTHHSI